MNKPEGKGKAGEIANGGGGGVQKVGRSLGLRFAAVQIALAVILADMRLGAGDGTSLEGGGQLVFETRFAATGWMSATLVISNQYTNFHYVYPFSIQRRDNQWRIQVASGTNGWATYYDVGCDGTNIYAVHHDKTNAAITKDRNAAQVYPGIICMIPNAERVWFAFCRDLVPAQERPNIPLPVLSGYMNHWAHIYLLKSNMILQQDKIIEAGSFVVDKERLNKAHLSPHLLVDEKSQGASFAPGQTGTVYTASFYKNNTGKYLQSEFRLISYWSKIGYASADGFASPDANRVLLHEYAYKIITIDDEIFNCYPVTGQLLDIIDYRLWIREKRMCTHLYKSTNFLGTNELGKAAYVLDVSKVMEEKKRGQKVFGAVEPAVVVLMAVLLAPLGYWLLVCGCQNKKIKRKGKT